MRNPGINEALGGHALNATGTALKNDKAVPNLIALN
jgi:hypothetical protein